MEEIIDNWAFKDNVLRREKIYKFKEKTLKIIVDRNYNNYDANIKVVLVDLENVKEITLLKYESENLKYKDLTCYFTDICKQYEIVRKNDEDIERILKEIKKVMEF